MKHLKAVLAATSIVATLVLSLPVVAQGAKQTITLTQVDPVVLATGFRASKVIGAEVYNDEKQEIGKVDDLIITVKDAAPYAVISVGGFLGMDKRHVVVPASALEVIGKQLILHSATKETLKALPAYEYAS